MINTNYSNINPSTVQRPSAVDFRHRQYNLQSGRDLSNYELPTVNPRFETLKDIANTLKQAADNITKDFPPLFEQLAASLSSDSVLEVTEVNPYSYDPESDSTDVSVYATASSQTNKGKEMYSDNSSFTEGANAFSIKNDDGSPYRFNINISKDESDISVQSKIAGAINTQDIGITASLYYDGATDTSSIILESKDTGEQSRFSVEDINGSDIVSVSGISNISEQGADAVYSVNDSMRTSSDNNVYLGNGINAYLLKSGSTQINIEPDISAITTGFSAFADAYNDLTDISDKFGSRDKLEEIYNVNAGKISESGISKNSEGNLTIDGDKLSKSVNKDTDKKQLTDFVSKVGILASELEYKTYSNSQEHLLELATRTGLEFQHAM